MSRFSLKSVLIFAASAIICVSVMGCGSKVTTDNAKKITTDMTQQQVEDILGKPSKTETHASISIGAVSTPAITTETWNDGDSKSIVVSFSGGKVFALPVTKGL